MAFKLQPMIPVYLPKRQQNVSDEDYDTGITQNEENLKQDLTRLTNMIAQLAEENAGLTARLKALEAKKK